MASYHCYDSSNVLHWFTWKKRPVRFNECRVSEITFSALTESINFTPLIQGLASSSKRHPNWSMKNYIPYLFKTQNPGNYTLFTGTYPYRPNKKVSPNHHYKIDHDINSSILKWCHLIPIPITVTRRLRTADCEPEGVKCRLSVKCRLQTEGKMQAWCKMQNKDCRLFKHLLLLL